jgi:TonB family protein
VLHGHGSFSPGLPAFMTGTDIRPHRSSPRFKIPPVQLTYLNFRSGNSGIVLDVSPAGLGFQALEPLQANQPQIFALAAPGSAQIYLSGRIAWLDETRKRGGLRVIVPVAERRAFQLWQQQCLGAVSEANQMMLSPRGTGALQPAETGAQESRTARNVLAGCLILALYVATIGGWHLLASTHTVRNVLARFDGTTAAAHPQASASKPSQDESRQSQITSRGAPSAASDIRSARKRRPPKYDARLSSPAVAATPPTSLQSTAEPIRAAPKLSAPEVGDENAAPVVASLAAASETHTANEERRNSEPPSQTSTAALRQPELQHTSPAPAYALTAHSPSTHSASAPRDRIAARLSATTHRNAPAAAPKSTSMAGASAANLSPVVQTPAPVLAATFEPCQLVSSVQPTYPDDARRQKIEGDVRLRVVVGTDGTVRSVSPLDGPPLLLAAAIDATRQFHYKPAIFNGQPIETIQTIDISFKLQR